MHAPVSYRPPPPSFWLSSLGVSMAGVAAGIKASGRPDVALLVSAEPLPCHGVFTENAFAAAPVKLCREHLARSGGMVRAMVVNAGNANACTGAQGDRDSHATAALVATRIGCPVEEVLVFSTGVIGVPLPFEKLRDGVARAFEALSEGVQGAENFLAAIQTTDAFPKAYAERQGEVSVAGIAKGAGMIEPNMATMLAFMGTDATLSPGELRALLPALARKSFNAVHVDSHASTNDSFVMFATGRNGSRNVDDVAARVAHRLAWMIARDGEGATKVTTVKIVGAKTDEEAERAARSIARSALVRTALFGNDPNWGRFVSAVGNAAIDFEPARLTCAVQGIPVFREGGPSSFNRAEVSTRMKEEDVLIEIDLGAGTGKAVLMTSDLSYRYVEVNAEYTT